MTAAPEGRPAEPRGSPRGVRDRHQPSRPRSGSNGGADREHLLQGLPSLLPVGGLWRLRGVDAGHTDRDLPSAFFDSEGVIITDRDHRGSGSGHRTDELQTSRARKAAGRTLGRGSRTDHGDPSLNSAVFPSSSTSARAISCAQSPGPQGCSMSAGWLCCPADGPASRRPYAQGYEVVALVKRCPQIRSPSGWSL
jgi:hypothetical protein